MSGRFAAGTANRTRMGRIWLIVTSGSRRGTAHQIALTHPETSGAPVIGARMVAYWRLSRAWSTAAWLAGQRRRRRPRHWSSGLVVLLRGHVLLLHQLVVALRLLLGVRRLGPVTRQDAPPPARARPG